MLDQYEINKEKKILAEVTSKMKAIAGDLRDLSANPNSKTKNNAPMLGQLSNKMKNLVQRTKTLATPSDDGNRPASTSVSGPAGITRERTTSVGTTMVCNKKC